MPVYLPAQFILYIPHRGTKKDPFAQFILINATHTEYGVHTIKPAPPVPASPYPYSHSYPYVYLDQLSAPPTTHYLFVLIVNKITNIPETIRLSRISHIKILTPAWGPEIPVLKFASTVKLSHFLDHGVSRNIPIVKAITEPTALSPTTPSPSTPSPPILTTVSSPILTPPVLTPAGGAGDPTPLPPSPGTKKKVTRKPAVAAVPEGDLCFHVARQLLTLARSRKEECPIIAEELTENNTAVMPCGHLLSRFGLEESFKIRRNECPICRTGGKPTYV